MGRFKEIQIEIDNEMLENLANHKQKLAIVHKELSQYYYFNQYKYEYFMPCDRVEEFDYEGNLEYGYIFYTE